MNDGMGAWIANQVIKMMISKDKTIKGAKILILGITFKENCPDIRNSKVIDLILELRTYGCKVEVYDPWADRAEVKHEYGLELLDIQPDQSNVLSNSSYNAVILAVAHDKFLELDLSPAVENKAVIYDVKGVLPRNLVTGRL
jgi:UDP-N-acetyl-D-galactosamine dehydrogenase